MVFGARMNFDLNFETIEDLADVIASYTHNVSIRYDQRYSLKKYVDVRIGFGMAKQYVEFDGFEEAIDGIELTWFYQLDELVQALEDKGVRVELIDVNTIKKQQPTTTRTRPRF